MYSSSIVLSALRDYDLYERVQTTIKLEWFNEKNRHIAEAILACHEDQTGRRLTWKEIGLKLKQKKTLHDLASVVKQSKKVDLVILHKQLSEFMELNLIEDIVIEMAEEKQAGKTLKHEVLIEKIEAAQKISHLRREHVDYFENDIADRIKESDRDSIISFPSSELSAAFDGGMVAGQLTTVLARTDGGKTMFVINCGRHCVQQGLNVLHCTHETTKIEVLRRYDCSFSNHSWNWVKTHSNKMRQILAKVKKQRGSLTIEDFSTTEASVIEIRISAERMVRDCGRLDLIIVDYGDLVRSSRHYDSKRDEHRLVWQELRRLAKRFSCPVITGTQSNRLGAGAKIPELTHMGESWAKATDSDAVIILHAPVGENRALAIVAKTKRIGNYSQIPIIFLRKKCYIR
jgi:replicative DNA helicase